jgi:hypothetical protein
MPVITRHVGLGAEVHVRRIKHNQIEGRGWKGEVGGISTNIGGSRNIMVEINSIGVVLVAPDGAVAGAEIEDAHLLMTKYDYHEERRSSRTTETPPKV